MKQTTGAGGPPFPRLAERASRKVTREIEQRLTYYADYPRQIDHRLEELAREWPIERVLDAELSLASILGLTLGVRRSRLWLVVPALLSGFLLQQACTGSSPPFLLLRRMGVRTAREIQYERAALKALRGDFAELGSLDGAGANG